MVVQSPNKIPPLQRAELCKGVHSTFGNRLPCGEKTPFRPIWLCDTGFHRLCLCLYLYPFTEVMHRILRSFLSADTPDCIHSPLPAQDRNPPDPLLQYTINAREEQTNTVKSEEGFQSGIDFLCNKSPLIEHKHIQSGPFAYKVK